MSLVPPKSIHPLAAVLRQARLDRGETLEQLAKRVGLSLSYLSRCEIADKPPPYKIREAYARAYNLDGTFFGAETDEKEHRSYFVAIQAALTSPLSLPVYPPQAEPERYDWRTYRYLESFNDVLDMASAMLRNARGTSATMFWSPTNPILSDGRCEAEFYHALDTFVKIKDGRVHHVIRIPESGQPDITVPIFTKALKFCLHYAKQHYEKNSRMARQNDGDASDLADRIPYRFTVVENTEIVKLTVEFFAVFNHGYIAALPDGQVADRCDGGFYMPQPETARSSGDGDAIAKYLKYIEQTAKPAVALYEPGGAGTLRLLDSELFGRVSEPHVMVSHFMYHATRPVQDFSPNGDWWQRYSHQDSPFAQRIAQRRIELAHGFEERLKRSESSFRQICSLGAVKVWAETGLRVDRSYDGVAKFETPGRYRFAYLDRLIDLLTRYNNFDLAFVGDTEPIEDNAWLVQGQHSVLAEARSWKGPEGDCACVAIRHRDIAEIMATNFNAQWDKLKHTKHNSISFLKGLRDSLTARVFSQRGMR